MASDMDGAIAYGPYVLAKVEKEPEGLIVRPENALMHLKWAKVLSVGSEVNDIKPGDVIMWRDSATFSKNAAIVMHDSAVFVDKKEGVISVHRTIIVAVKPATPQNS
jgi:hypothetical protein